MSLLSGYNEWETVAIRLLHVEDRGSKVFLSFTATYKNGQKKTVRTNVKNLSGYYGSGAKPKPITHAEMLGGVYCGLLKTDARLIFLATLSDGTVQLVQEKEGSYGCKKLLEVCDLLA